LDFFLAATPRSRPISGIGLSLKNNRPVWVKRY
jgi:hypothetical protein